MSNDAIRATLVERGRRRVERYTWTRTALHFRALYRQIGGRIPEQEDLDLLNGDAGY